MLIILILAFADGTPDFRDFRVTTNPTILDAFLKDLESVQARLVLSKDYRGSTFGSVNANPRSSVGGLPSASSGGQIARLSYTVIFATIIAYS